MARGPNLEILALRLILRILNSDRESHRTRSTFSSIAVTAGIQGNPACIRTSTGLNSRNIYPNPIDSLKEFQASEKEIYYEPNKEKNCKVLILPGGSS